MKHYFPIIFILAFASSFTIHANAQQQSDSVVTKNSADTSHKTNSHIKVHINEKESDLTFTGTRVAEKDENYASTGKITLSGYISTYYAYYTDTASVDGFQKFPTVAPRSNAFGLNIAQFSTKYTSDKFRGMFTLHYGDIPHSAWSSTYNMIQEANVGFRIHPKVWIDAGFFRTHIGLESIQPRENITISLATVTYYEPYFMSGAKITWQPTSKLTLQANAFNSFNTFIETNKNKAFGLSVVYELNSKLNFVFNTITCDESPTNSPRKQQRLYNNLYFTYKTKKISIGGEINYGAEKHSQLIDTMKTANMMSALLVIKYNFTKTFAAYARGEYFTDKNEILTGPIVNQNHTLVGLDIKGITAGMEVKLIPNSYIRLEGRMLQTPNSEKIFYYNKTATNKRLEGIMAIGVWF